eukprot:PITA_28812
MGRFNGYNTVSLHFVFLICLLFISFPLGFSELRASDCTNDTGYAHGSRYERNLNTVMHDLVKNVEKTGFNTSWHGDNAEEKVYGLVQCRDDTSTQECSSCAQEASITIQHLCENDIGGRVWFDVCFLRYDNFSFFSDLDTHVVYILHNPQTVKNNPAGFQNDVMDLLRPLTGENSDLASKRLAADFATSSFSDTHRVFGLVECWRDLPIEQCKSCLLIALTKIYPILVKEGGEAFLGSCRIRFETYPFSTLFPSNATAHQRKSPRNVAILCGSIAGGLLVSVICLYISVKKISKMRSMTMESPVPIKPMEKDSESRDGLSGSGSLFNPQIVFSLDTLTEATGEFHEDNKLGEGGFGAVYKGITYDGREIAVKKLSLRSAQGTREFMNEVKLVAKIQHRNLVQLLGCCVDGPERLLVYEYLPNKSLDNFLFDPEKRRVLDWQKRYNIVMGIARGLLYLHEDSQLRIIHRDVKVNNILLDDKLNPKIADFGLARLFPDDETHVHTTVAGTYGYMAPEYAMLGQLSVKSDVYSFGVVLLEIVSGRRHTDIRLPQEMQNLLEWGWRLCNEGNLLNMIDPTIVGCLVQEQALKCIRVGLLCVQADVSNRPAMSDVVVMLSTSSAAIPNPTKPAFVSLSFSGDGHTKDGAVTTSSAPSQIQLSVSNLSRGPSSSTNGSEARENNVGLFDNY